MTHSILVFVLLALCSQDILNGKLTKQNTLNAKKRKKATEKNRGLQQKSSRKKAGYSLTPQLGTQALGDSSSVHAQKGL